MPYSSQKKKKKKIPLDQISLNQSIMHYLNHTITMLLSLGEKKFAQLIISTFSSKGNWNY